MDTIYQKLLLISFFALPLVIVFIVLKILQHDKWKRTQNILSKMKNADFESFDNIRFQTTNFSYLKAFTGIPQKGTLFVNKTQLILLNSKKPYILNITSTLPLVIKNVAGNHFSIKVCNWKAILLTLNFQLSGVGFIKTELLLEPKDQIDFERLKKELNYWC